MVKCEGARGPSPMHGLDHRGHREKREGTENGLGHAPAGMAKHYRKLGGLRPLQFVAARAETKD